MGLLRQSEMYLVTIPFITIALSRFPRRVTSGNLARDWGSSFVPFVHLFPVGRVPTSRRRLRASH